MELTLDLAGIKYILYDRFDFNILGKTIVNLEEPMAVFTEGVSLFAM